MQLTGDFDAIINATPLQPFDDSVVDFLNALSKKLIIVREYSDVATFGFWCRKSALIKEKGKYDDLQLRFGKGVVFHSTPSNVPVNFAFSFAAGLLAGNANIIRLPGKDFEQVTIIVDAINDLLENEYAMLANYLCFVKYPSNNGLHDKFSSVCDVRVIWGGDNTINELRQSPLKPRATELTFADRYSIAVINADEYFKADDKQKIAQDFYNDTYFTDQNACTSPRIIFWIGDKKETAKVVFWENIRKMAKEKYDLAPVQAVGKLATFYNATAKVPLRLMDAKDSYVTRVYTENVSEYLMQFKYNSGFYFEYDIDELKDILPICGERLQTLTYYGITPEKIAVFLAKHRPKGIDRAVPMGKSMDFTLIWDGYDLIRHLSRKVVVQ